MVRQIHVCYVFTLINLALSYLITNIISFMLQFCSFSCSPMSCYAMLCHASCRSSENYSRHFWRMIFVSRQKRPFLTLTWRLGQLWVFCHHAVPLPSSCSQTLTSTSETSFFGQPPPPCCCCCWMTWTRAERLSKVWGAGGRVSFREETRTTRCWGQERRGRVRSRRTESQQSFSLFTFSCSTNTSLLSSSCSSACRVCEGRGAPVVCVFKVVKRPIWPFHLSVCVFQCLWGKRILFTRTNRVCKLMKDLNKSLCSLHRREKSIDQH